MMTIIQKQPAIFNQLLHAWQQQKLTHAYLFYGAKGVGTFDMALWLAKTIFCQSPSHMGACNTCLHCQRIQSNDFLDVQVIRPDTTTIKVNQIRQLKEDLNYSSMETKQKVIIIDEVDTMTVSATNSLLKFLEEPDYNVYFLLLTDRKELLLQTIISRCQLVPFPNLSVSYRQEQLMAQDIPLPLVQVVSYLTQDNTVASQLAMSKDFITFQKCIWQWYQYILKQDTMAFIYIQVQLVSYLSNKELANLGLQLIVLYMRDTLFVHHKKDAIYFPTNRMIYEKGFLSANSFVHVLNAQQQLSANVSAQVCYEVLCLELLNDK